MKNLNSYLEQLERGIAEHLREIYKQPVTEIKEISYEDGATVGKCLIGGKPYRFSIKQKQTEVKPIEKP